MGGNYLCMAGCIEGAYVLKKGYVLNIYVLMGEEHAFCGCVTIYLSHKKKNSKLIIIGLILKYAKCTRK